MMVSFTEQEKEMLHGHSLDIAKRCNCSKYYVHKILQGRREANTDTAKAIVKAAHDIIRFKKKFSQAS